MFHYIFLSLQISVFYDHFTHFTAWFVFDGIEFMVYFRKTVHFVDGWCGTRKKQMGDSTEWITQTFEEEQITGQESFCVVKELFDQTALSLVRHAGCATVIDKGLVINYVIKVCSSKIQLVKRWNIKFTGFKMTYLWYANWFFIKMGHLENPWSWQVFVSFNFGCIRLFRARKTKAAKKVLWVIVEGNYSLSVLCIILDTEEE